MEFEKPLVRDCFVAVVANIGDGGPVVEVVIWLVIVVVVIAVAAVSSVGSIPPVAISMLPARMRH